MPDLHDQDDQFRVVNLVDDAEVTRAHPPFPRSTDELAGRGRPWITRQEIDGRLHATPAGRIELP